MRDGLVSCNVRVWRCTSASGILFIRGAQQVACGLSIMIVGLWSAKAVWWWMVTDLCAAVRLHIKQECCLCLVPSRA